MFKKNDTVNVPNNFKEYINIFITKNKSTH